MFCYFQTRGVVQHVPMFDFLQMSGCLQRLGPSVKTMQVACSVRNPVPGCLSSHQSVNWLVVANDEILLILQLLMEYFL